MGGLESWIAALLAVTAGLIPSWETALQRTYERESPEWQALSSWLQKGTASGYYIQRSIDSGTLVSDAGDGQQLNLDREYTLTDSSPSDGPTTAVLTFEISTDAPGSNVVAGPRSYTISAEYETLQ